MPKFTLYFQKVLYFRQQISARERQTADRIGGKKESEKNCIPTGEEFYHTSTEENEDAEE